MSRTTRLTGHGQLTVPLGVALLSAVSCGADSAYQWQLPLGFPQPKVPSSNPMTTEKIELGRHLFYDTRLSGNQTQACASCHKQSLAFSDGHDTPEGSTGEPHPRNSLSLTNSAYSATLTWANPALDTLERQIPVPMFGEFPIELGISGQEDEVLSRLAEDGRYVDLFTTAFPDDAEPVTFENIVKSLACFVRTLISGNSPFDRFAYHNEDDALSDAARRGMSLFFSERLECHHCHGGFNFSQSTEHERSGFVERPFHNTGLFNIGGTGAYPADNTGLAEFTEKPEDMGRFRAPTLRNIALTAPYMHDGSMQTLEEVVDFYARGGRLIESGDRAGDGRDSPFKSPFVSGFEIMPNERADLVEFLKSLTDPDFIADPRFRSPE